MRRRMVLTPIWCVLCAVSAVLAGCATESKDAAKRDVVGPYRTWNDVISRWVGGQVTDLYVELGPPNLHPHELENGAIEMVWDFGIDRMPGQADEFNLLPLYGGNVNCQIHFIADPKGTILRGERVGCE
jgi:hypothetical protein